MIPCGYNKEYIILFFSGALPERLAATSARFGPFSVLLPVLPKGPGFVSPSCIRFAYPHCIRSPGQYRFVRPLASSIADRLQSYQTHAFPRSSYCTILRLCARCICLYFYHFPLEFIACALYNNNQGIGPDAAYLKRDTRRYTVDAWKSGWRIT